MKDLAAMFASAGAQEVRTYIQSGNVIFRAIRPEKVCHAVKCEITARYGYAGLIVHRSADELMSAWQQNPFLPAGFDPSSLHVYFLGAFPAAADVQALDPSLASPDAFAIVGREVYLYLPNGMARTKLTNAYFDRALKTVSTARNWRTIGALTRMLERLMGTYDRG